MPAELIRNVLQDDGTPKRILDLGVSRPQHLWSSSHPNDDYHIQDAAPESGMSLLPLLLPSS